MIEVAISKVLCQRVDTDGKASNYVRDNSDMLVEYLCKDAIQKAVQEAIIEEVGKHKDVIKKSIVEQITKKNSPLLNTLAEGMVTGLIDTAKSNWLLKVEYQRQ